MTRDPQDPFWAELQTRARRWAPRYAAEYGTCKSCGLGATALIDIPPVTHAHCAPCDTRWDVGINLFDPSDEPSPADPDTQAELEAIHADVLYAAMLTLANAHHFHEETMTNTPTPHSDIRALDPWPTATTFQSCRDAQAPRLWYFLTPAARQRIGGLALHIARHPARTLPGGCEGLLRATHEKALGFGPKGDALLQGYYVVDAEEREAWRQAAVELRDPRVSSLLAEAVRILRTAAMRADEATAVRDALLGQR